MCVGPGEFKSLQFLRMEFLVILLDSEYLNSSKVYKHIKIQI